MTKYYQILMMGLLAFAPIAGSDAIAAQHSLPAAVEIKQQSQKAPNSSDFSQFRSRLADAVQRADAKFIRAIATPQTQWSYGGTRNLESYNINSNQSKFWAYMGKALKQGCTVDSEARAADKEPGSSVWACPNLTKVKQSIRPDRPNYGNLAIIGQNVNIRSEPGMGGRIIGTVSDDYVAFNPAGYNSLPAGAKEKMQADPVNGWTPVRLRTGVRGWVLNQYVYDEENDYRVSFVRSRGQWRLRYFLPGNGN